MFDKTRISQADFVSVLSKWGDVVNRHVPDKDVRNRIADDIKKLDIKSYKIDVGDALLYTGAWCAVVTIPAVTVAVVAGAIAAMKWALAL